MIPMWMFGIALACGNAFILKPSEKDPSVPVRLAELMLEAGAPEGILNVVQGDKTVVDAILTHDDIRAVSFVGSSDIAHYVYSTGTANGKRVQAMGARRTTALFCPMRIWIRSWPILPEPPLARPVNAAWHCPWRCLWEPKQRIFLSTACAPR